MTDGLTKDMALTREEFVRLLPGAAGDLPWREEAGRFRLGAEDAGVDITLDPQPPRRIALFTLPVMRVSFRFHGWSAAERDAFVKRFDLAFQRGGG